MESQNKKNEEITLVDNKKQEVEVSERVKELFGFESGEKVISPGEIKFKVRGIAENPLSPSGELVVFLEFLQGKNKGLCGIVEKNLREEGFVLPEEVEKIKEKEKQRVKALKKSGNYVECRTLRGGEKMILDTSEETCKKYGLSPEEEVEVDLTKTIEESEDPLSILTALLSKNLRATVKGAGPEKNNGLGNQVLWLQPKGKNRVVFISNEHLSCIEKIS